VFFYIKLFKNFKKHVSIKKIKEITENIGALVFHDFL